MPTHPDLCSTGDSLLVLVDIQPRLTAAMADQEAADMLRHCGRLIDAAAALQVPVLVTRQYPEGLGDIDENLAAKLPQNTPVFDKTGFSCCAAPGFENALERSGRRQIILVGQETHVCILQTALDLRHKGYVVYVPEDAVCSRRVEHKSNALNRMQRRGVTVTNHESILFEWLRDASHPEFKRISALLR